MVADWVWLGAAVFILLLMIWLLRTGWRAQKANWGNAIINSLDGLNRIFCVRYHGLVFDRIPLPERGGAILAANHVSGLDPLLLGCASPRPLRYMIATEQYNRPWLKWLYRGMGCIPVDRDGAPEKAFYAARQALNAGELIMVFPQGRIVPLDETVKLKRGAILLADLAQAPIIPLRLSGINGAGRVLSAILIRCSRARLEAGPVIRVKSSKDRAALEQLQAFITVRPEPRAEA
jgi:1-acyl-sn-glycerol-3-phosphate acyltransferase